MNSRRSRLWPTSDAVRPGRDVVVALAIKGLLLLLLYALFFGSSHRVPADAGATAEALIGARHAGEIR